MVFRHFRFHVVVRILLLASLLAALVYCLMIEKYLRSTYLAVGLVIAVLEFVRFSERTARDLTSFLTSIRQNDFTTSYYRKGRGKSYDQLYEVFNSITQKFRAISEDKEAQFRYLELLVEHVRVGILSFDKDDHIHLMNDTMKQYLGRPHAHSLKGLELQDAGFVQTIRSIRVGENKLIKMQVGNKVVPLAIHASEFNLQGKYFKLISAQDIRNELEANELEAWQKLIRVLTHEIMNSISPVMSLSSTLHDMVVQHRLQHLPLEAKTQENLEQGLDAIRVRSGALRNFTQAYRSLTRIPQPQFKTVKINDLFEHLKILFTNEIGEKNIALTIAEPKEALVVFADPDLIQQVLINLFKNAMDAVQDLQHPQITLLARQEGNQVAIQLHDNGPGIPDDIIDQIFIPFFTTKKSGSGIGLAFSKQILQMHGGQIHVDNMPAGGTSATIIL